jgi:hypothetical protein
MTERAIPHRTSEAATSGTAMSGTAMSGIATPDSAHTARAGAPEGAAGSEPLYWIVIAVFSIVAIGVILRIGDRPVEPLHLLLFACGVGALVASLVWLLAVALDHSTPWSLALVTPYVNALVLPLFIRLYWAQGARAPGMLLIAGIVCETAGAVLMLGGGRAFLA